jgi:hypothetical protein
MALRLRDINPFNVFKKVQTTINYKELTPAEVELLNSDDILFYVTIKGAVAGQKDVLISMSNLEYVYHSSSESSSSGSSSGGAIPILQKINFDANMVSILTKPIFTDLGGGVWSFGSMSVGVTINGHSHTIFISGGTVTIVVGSASSIWTINDMTGLMDGTLPFTDGQIVFSTINSGLGGLVSGALVQGYINLY